MNNTNKQKLIDADNNLVVTRGNRESGEVDKGQGSQIHGDGRRFDSGW